MPPAAAWWTRPRWWQRSRRARSAGAALDCFETEPLTKAAAEIFRGCENLILTPHIAGVTEESNVRVSTMIADLVLDRLT